MRRSIEDFFDNLDFLQVETPIIVRSPGAEVHLDYFETNYQSHTLNHSQLFLRSSPEIHLKQLLRGEGPGIYEIGPCYRNGGELSQWHHPEFTMLEWYSKTPDLAKFMKQTVDLLHFTADSFEDQCKIQLPQKFEILTMYEAFENYLGIPLVDGDTELAAKGKDRGFISLREDDDFETAYFKLIIDGIEPELRKLPAVIIHDYPPSQASLAQVIDHRAKRFEIYIDGIELCNAFQELLDPALNQERLNRTNHLRREITKPEIPVDPHFINGLHNSQPYCGNALGVDRWLALVLGLDAIDTIIPFRNNLYPDL